MFKKISIMLVLVICLVIGFSGSTFADNYPTHPIEFIVPWSPGGGSDTLMRIVAKYLGEYLGVAVPVINKPGVAGTLGLIEAVDKPNDGYTIAQIHEGLPTAYHLGITEINYDDFLPVASMTSSPQYLAVGQDFPADTMEEFVEYAKEHPNEVLFGCTMRGIIEIWGAMFEDLAGIQLKYVSYEGTGDRVKGLAGGFVDSIIVDYPSANQFVKAGKFRFLASATKERLEWTPDIPTMIERGLDMEWSIRRGIVVPKDTPLDRVKILEEGLRKVAQDKNFIKDIETAGGDVEFVSFEDYGAYLKKLDADIARAAKKVEH